MQEAGGTEFNTWALKVLTYRATWKLLCGGGEGGGMGFRAWPFVLCKNGCWRQRRRNTKFGPKKYFPPKISPPHISVSQNDQRDVGIILSQIRWVRPPPPP